MPDIKLRQLTSWILCEHYTDSQEGIDNVESLIRNAGQLLGNLIEDAGSFELERVRVAREEGLGMLEVDCASENEAIIDKLCVDKTEKKKRRRPKKKAKKVPGETAED